MVSINPFVSVGRLLLFDENVTKVISLFLVQSQILCDGSLDLLIDPFDLAGRYPYKQDGISKNCVD